MRGTQYSTIMECSKLHPKRECPDPKPGGLIGQVLGVKEDREEVEGLKEEQLSITKRVEKAFCRSL